MENKEAIIFTSFTLTRRVSSWTPVPVGSQAQKGIVL